MDTESGLTIQGPSTEAELLLNPPRADRVAIPDENKRLKTVAWPKDLSSLSFDMIAIHGESGDTDLSWTDRDTGYNWLQEALPLNFPSAQVYSYSPRNNIDNVVETLILDLLDERSITNRSELPIFFIGHSLGGTLIKKLFIESSPARNSIQRINDFHTKIAGFVFMGTRQRGTFSETPLGRATRVWNLIPSLSRNMADLQTVLADVPIVNSEFKLLRGERMPLACFYEGQETNLGGMKMTLVSRADAIVDDDGLYFRENRQLDKRHANLSRFSSSDDPELKRVIGTMKRLVEYALRLNESLTTQPQSPSLAVFHTSTQSAQTQSSNTANFETTKLRLLSLDGGGVRGLFTIAVLEALMEEIRILTKANGDIKPCDFFDLIGGTSTGGLLAVMLARLRMDIMSCKKQYRELSKIIFEKRGWNYPGKMWVNAYFGRSWYPAEPLEASIKSVVAERICVQERKQRRSSGHAVENSPLRSEHVSKAGCFVCAIRNGNRGCARIRSYVSQNDDTDISCAIWEACRATSAAQLYFPPMQIGTETYWDGGSESNNPVQETYDEAFLKWSDQRPLSGIVSIGTGMPKHRDPGTKALDVVQSFISHATDTESTHIKFKERHPQLKDVYFRLQGSLDLGAIDLADWTKLDVIERMAQEYIDSEEGQSEIERCARQLVR